VSPASCGWSLPRLPTNWDLRGLTSLTGARPFPSPALKLSTEFFIALANALFLLSPMFVALPFFFFFLRGAALQQSLVFSFRPLFHPPPPGILSVVDPLFHLWCSRKSPELIHFFPSSPYKLDFFSLVEGRIDFLFSSSIAAQSFEFLRYLVPS